MASLLDLEKDNNLSPSAEENSKPNAFVSALAGIGSGLFKIPEGFVSLGATLIDLGADTNKAAEVEKWFAKINPFDEMAEATTAGKITELITNIGVPGGIAFKVGSGLAKGALMAKQSDKYFDLGGEADGQNIEGLLHGPDNVPGPAYIDPGNLSSSPSMAGDVDSFTFEATYQKNVDDGNAWKNRIPLR